MRIYLALDWPDDGTHGAVAVTRTSHGERVVLFDRAADPWSLRDVVDQAVLELELAAGLDRYPDSRSLF